jgi:ribosomal-protein-alanine N-acetyltransferase
MLQSMRRAGDVGNTSKRLTANQPRMTLETSRLVLIPCAPQQLVALIEQPDRFETLTGFPAADGLREFFVSDDVSPTWPEAVRRGSSPDPWRHGFFVVDRDRQCVIGTAGFKGPPDAVGVVEIAYGIVSSAEGRGYATEAASALVDFALKSPDVVLIRAHTLPVSNASTRVLLKCGFRHVGSVVDPEDGLVWRWERGRDSSGDVTEPQKGD